MKKNLVMDASNPLSGMLAAYLLRAAVIVGVAWAASALTGCNPYGMQPYGYNNGYGTGGYGSMGGYGPVGASAGLRGGQMFMPPGAGMNMYAGSGFDPATHGQIVAEDMARTSFVVGSAQAGPVTVPNGSSAIGGGSAVRVGGSNVATTNQRISQLATAIARDHIVLTRTQGRVRTLETARDRHHPTQTPIVTPTPATLAPAAEPQAPAATPDATPDPAPTATPAPAPPSAENAEPPDPVDPPQ